MEWGTNEFLKRLSLQRELCTFFPMAKGYTLNKGHELDLPGSSELVLAQTDRKGIKVGIKVVQFPLLAQIWNQKVLKTISAVISLVYLVTLK